MTLTVYKIIFRITWTNRQYRRSANCWFEIP